MEILFSINLRNSNPASTITVVDVVVVIIIIIIVIIILILFYKHQAMKHPYCCSTDLQFSTPIHRHQSWKPKGVVSLGWKRAADE
jgi:amino acid transporter